MSSRQHIHKPQNRGDKLADQVTEVLGSWRFIVIQSIVLALWIILNTIALVTHWDPAPFILLNLCLSFQAAFTGPVVLLSQNRQSAKDRIRDDHESVIVDKTAVIITKMSELLGKVAEDHTILMQMNRQQLEILNQQTEMLELLKRPQPTSKLKAVRAVRSEEDV